MRLVTSGSPFSMAHFAASWTNSGSAGEAAVAYPASTLCHQDTSPCFKAVSGFVLKLGCISSCKVGLIDMFRPTDGSRDITSWLVTVPVFWLAESKGFAQPI